MFFARVVNVLNEVLSKEGFKSFCNLKTADKNFYIKYLSHRQGKFMAQVSGGDKIDVFKLPSDLQVFNVYHAIRLDALMY